MSVHRHNIHCLVQPATISHSYTDTSDKVICSLYYSEYDTILLIPGMHNVCIIVLRGVHTSYDDIDYPNPLPLLYSYGHIRN